MRLRRITGWNRSPAALAERGSAGRGAPAREAPTPSLRRAGVPGGVSVRVTGVGLECRAASEQVVPWERRHSFLSARQLFPLLVKQGFFRSFGLLCSDPAPA